MWLFKELFEMFSDWPLGTIVGILILGTVLALAVLAVRGLYFAIDSWFLPKKRGTGRIVGKTFTPAHTQVIMMYNVATKTNMPQIIHRPDDWSVSVEVGGKQDDISIGQELYDLLSEGSMVMAGYVTGRFSGNLYLKEIFQV